nr:xylulose kinase-1 [Tanacetum cinerariifolium]
MKMEQYLAHTDYAPWKLSLMVIVQFKMSKDEANNEIKVPPITTQQILARTRERKAKSTLLMAFPDEHLARFYGIKDDKTLWAAIKTRFGDNAKSKKMQKNVVKQQFEIFSLSNSEGLEQRPGIDTLDIDDMYNNLKAYEADIKGSSGSSSISQNVAFVFAESTNRTNELNVAYNVSTAIGHSSQAQGEMLILEELLSNDSLSLSKNKSFHFDIPSSPRSLAKPLDDDEMEPNSGILTVKVVGDIFKHYVPIPRRLPTQPTLALNQEKFPHLLSHLGLKAFQLPSKSPMMIYGGNSPILDVPFLNFYPP